MPFSVVNSAFGKSLLSLSQYSTRSVSILHQTSVKACGCASADRRRGLMRPDRAVSRAPREAGRARFLDWTAEVRVRAILEAKALHRLLCAPVPEADGACVRTT